MLLALSLPASHPSPSCIPSLPPSLQQLFTSAVSDGQLQSSPVRARLRQVGRLVRNTDQSESLNNKQKNYLYNTVSP